jgi:hypothetical protein
VAGALIALGIALRSVRYWSNPIALWGDEAAWARNLLERPLTRLEFRPVGLMAGTRWLTELSAVVERALRLPSYLAGIAVLFLALWVGGSSSCTGPPPWCCSAWWRRARSSWTSPRVQAVLGRGGAAPDPARDRLSYWRTRSRRWLLALVLAAAARLSLRLHAVFAYVVPFGLALLDRSRARDRRGLAVAAGGAAFCLGFVGLVYATVSSQIDAPDEAAFWGGSTTLLPARRGRWRPRPRELDPPQDGDASPPCGRAAGTSGCRLRRFHPAAVAAWSSAN